MEMEPKTPAGDTIQGPGDSSPPLLWDCGLSAGEHRCQWGLSVSLNVFWFNEALPNQCV